MLYEEAYKELNQICIYFQKNCGATEEEVNKLLKETLVQWEKN
tara:strand:- start:87 stop:215 length:129 start_codon:yes stop_codon:yes gene_type:complete